MSSPERDDNLASATKALAEALSQFTKSIGTGISQTSSAVTRDATSQLSSSLHEAAKGLTDASNNIVNRSTDGRRARAQHTRERLLSAARHLFATRGYEGASVADIAKEAGVTKGALYANFDSKEDLFLEIMRGLTEDDAAYLASVDPEELATMIKDVSPDPDSDVSGTSHELSESLERTLLGLEGWIYAVRHEESRAEFREAYSRTLEQIAAMVGERAGHEKPTESDTDVALGLVALQTVSQILGTILGPEKVNPAIARITQRLLKT